MDDERGSLSLFLVVALVGLMLSALLVPMVITSARATRTTSSRVQALDVAQAGIDVTLGKIRAATDSSGLGDESELPCTTTAAPIMGSVGPASYSVTVDYFTVDPDKFPNTLKMLCVPGYGTYDPTSGTATPSYARVTSTGAFDAPANGTTSGRTLISTYVLQTSNTNIAGGTIRIYPASASSPALCIDAGSSTPVATTALLVQGCSTTSPPAGQQTFAYRNDLTIQLVSSVTTSYPRGLCLDSGTSPGAGSAIILKSCPADGVAPPYTQQWSYNDNGKYEAALPTSSTNGGLAGLCLGIPAQNAALPVTLLSCDGSQGWIPAPSVGAGAAVQPQWVNANEFGRCLDVTNQDVNSAHLIDYPCKQNPYAGAVTWNQKFTPPTPTAGATSATGPFYTNPNGTNYCLTSPLSAGGYVTVQPCVGLLASQQWTVYGGASSLAYSTKYTIVDSSGRCLGLTLPASGEVWSAIAVDSCTGSTTQKWNASPNLTSPTLQNTRER